MKVVIVYLIKGKAQKYQKKIIKKSADLSGERYISYDNPLPQHVTLKSPFDIKNIKKLESVLYNFTKEQKKSTLKIRKFGNFNRFVAFLKIEFPLSAKRTQKKLVKILNKEYNLKLHEHEKNWKPHATISYGNNDKNFTVIWKYLKSLKKPNFDLNFDNITILKKLGGSWKIHKTFNILN